MVREAGSKPDEEAQEIESSPGAYIAQPPPGTHMGILQNITAKNLKKIFL